MICGRLELPATLASTAISSHVHAARFEQRIGHRQVELAVQLEIVLAIGIKGVLPVIVKSDALPALKRTSSAAVSPERSACAVRFNAGSPSGLIAGETNVARIQADAPGGRREAIPARGRFPRCTLRDHIREKHADELRIDVLQRGARIERGQDPALDAQGRILRTQLSASIVETLRIGDIAPGDSKCATAPR